MSQPLSKSEQFNQLPRPYKQLRFTNSQILRAATVLKVLPDILVPSNDRRVMLPPLVNYGYPLRVERMDELLEQKLGCPPRIIDTNPFDLLIHLRYDVFNYNLEFRTVYCDGTDSMLFMAIGSNWKPAPPDRLEGVVKKLKDFLDVEEEPVWCLDSEQYYWRK